MKFLVNVDIAPNGGITAAGLATIAEAIEETGLDAVGFADHPAPSARWLESGGHGTLDPFAAMSFVAARTHRIAVVANLLVVPYRNPLLQGTSMASVDLLAAGRSIFVLGAGYSRPEFTALGVNFDERNDLFDEGVDVMRRYLAGEPVVHDGRHFRAIGQRRHPLPVTRPHPTMWFGGNSNRALDRAAQWGRGWSAMVAPAAMARTARTPPLVSHDDIRRSIGYLSERSEVHGRSVGDITVCVNSPAIGPGAAASAARQHDEVARLHELGVSWVSVQISPSDPAKAVDELHAFADLLAG